MALMLLCVCSVLDCIKQSFIMRTKPLVVVTLSQHGICIMERQATHLPDKSIFLLLERFAGLCWNHKSFAITLGMGKKKKQKVDWGKKRQMTNLTVGKLPLRTTKETKRITLNKNIKSCIADYKFISSSHPITQPTK